MQFNTCSALIKHIHCAMQKRANNELRQAGLTFAQMHLLFTLQKQENGYCSLKELERMLGVAQSTTVGLVKRCGEKGLVECFGLPEDRRVKAVRITEKGLSTCHNTEVCIRRSEEDLMRNLTSEEQSTLLVLLAKVYDSFSPTVEEQE